MELILYWYQTDDQQVKCGLLRISAMEENEAEEASKDWPGRDRKEGNRRKLPVL